MTEPFEVEVETYCSKAKCQVRLILRSNREQKGEIVEGKPVYCNHQHTCQYNDPAQLLFSKDAKCFLNALRIETRRHI